jgi:hypothetical protein
MKHTIQSLAAEMSKAFEGAVRPANGETFRKLKDDSPAWMTTVCRKAHDDGQMMPDDWRYEFIERAVDVLADHEDPDDACNALEADVYTFDLTAWLHSRCSRVYYLGEVMNEYGAFKDGFQLLAAAQLWEKQEVFQQVLAALQEELTTNEAADDATAD